jgi:hypothetical protein
MHGTSEGIHGAEESMVRGNPWWKMREEEQECIQEQEQEYECECE